MKVSTIPNLIYEIKNNILRRIVICFLWLPLAVIIWLFSIPFYVISGCYGLGKHIGKALISLILDFIEGFYRFWVGRDELRNRERERGLKARENIIKERQMNSEY